ncbi:MAG: serine hydrolase [Bacteroidales bacterium]|jgi:CubicO group peptidase (beta-lactamase class C family)|nr:serine hydrolase [Bacteroidales bacterium]MBP7875119.1 serine hydrolase [Bacteroidales bacterium]MCZ2282891.1 serine hydrolase [Bacteroidales bacterium]
MKRKLQTYSLVIFALIGLNFSFSLFAQSEYQSKLSILDEYYAKALSDWKVPGMAIAIVKDGEIIYAKGFGVKDVRTKEPVDSETLFPIASNTKAFTSAALAILVDRGLISWSDKVTDYLPYFKLWAPYVTENITISDLLTHRAGLATFSGDLLWYGTLYSREEIIKRARHLKPAFGFRERFGYSNILYIAAGEIIPAVTGKSWEEFIKEELLESLKMNRTVLSTNDLPGKKNVATPHTDYNEDVIPIEYLNWDNMGPAGSLISCVNDVAKWLVLQLNRGVIDGDTIFSSERSREMWTSYTQMPISSFLETNMPSTTFRSYGLGWGLWNYLGKKIVEHNGGYDGMISQTCMAPEENLAFVILTNKNSNLYYPLMYKTLDTFLGGEEKDWSMLLLDRVKKQKEAEEKRREQKNKERIKNTDTSLPLNCYTGTYGGELYGNAMVKLNGEKLTVHMQPAPIFEGTLKHWHFDTFEITFENIPSLPSGFCTFILDNKGQVAEMKIDIPNPDFDFTELEFIRKK